MASLVSNVDGTYWADDPRDHCRHGVYVGGCGYDFMCHYCEMDYPDPTPNDYLREFNRAKWEIIDFWVRIVENAGLGVPVFAETIARSGLSADLSQAWQSYDLASEWADDGEDDGWLSSRHRAEIEAYDLAKERGMV